MQLFKFGAWEIEADVEATREYYQNFQDKDSGNQAYRNYKEFCKTQTIAEKAFFDNVGIQPEFVFQFNTFGMDKSGILHCSGYYPVVGKYMKCLDEIMEFGIDYASVEPPTQAGRYSYYSIPKEEGFLYDLLPEILREQLVLIMFSVDIHWHLQEECTLKLASRLRWWEIGKKVRLAEKYKQMGAQYRMAREASYERLIGTYQSARLTDIEANQLCKKWFAEFVPKDKQRAARKNCFSTKRYLNHLWHAFSFKYVPCEEQDIARKLFNAQDKSRGVYVLIQDIKAIAYILDNPDGIMAEDVDNILDVYVIAKDFSYTYVHTHEDSMGLGPYFFKKQIE